MFVPVSTAAQPLTVTGTLAVVPSILTPVSRKSYMSELLSLMDEAVKMQNELANRKT